MSEHTSTMPPSGPQILMFDESPPWPRRIRKNPVKRSVGKQNRWQTPESFRDQVVAEYVNGTESVNQLSIRHNIGARTLGKWIRARGHKIRTLSYNLTNQPFGRLVARYVAEIKHDSRHWLCECSCGKRVIVRQQHLLAGLTQSCGCLKSDHVAAAVRTHGLYRSSEYGIWQSMLQRCENPNDDGYRRYGGRGIRVCDRWRESFESFYADMGPRPSRRHSIDRKENDGNYEPDNCRWATPREQNGNKSVCVMLTSMGKTQCVAEWSREIGISTSAIRSRMRKGLPVDQVLSPGILRRAIWSAGRDE